MSGQDRGRGRGGRREALRQRGGLARRGFRSRGGINTFGGFDQSCPSSSSERSQSPGEMESSKQPLVDKSKAISTSTLLTVVVGADPNQDSFSIHEGVICARSEFFRRAMNGNNWAEREERLITLPEDDPKVFATYINHVYTNNIATFVLGQTRTGSMITAEILHLTKLYVFGEKLCDPTVKNATVEAILTVGLEKDSFGNSYLPGRESVKVMYDGTPAGSHGRRLMADLWTNFSVESDYFALSFETLPKEFWFDLALAPRKDRTSGKKSVGDANGASEYLEKVD